MSTPRYVSFARAVSHVFVTLGLVFAVSAQAAEPAADKALEEQILKVIREHPKEIMEAVVTYQRAQAEQRMKTAETRLQEQVAQLKGDELTVDAPQRGKIGSPLVLVEFSDFQCPYCAKAHAIVEQFMAAHGQEVVLVYRHLPLGDMHPQATPAALAAWAAQQQGKFWEFHDALFDAQERLGEIFYTETARKLGLDLARFDKDRHGAAAQSAIDRDIELAKKLGITATPQFLMNGKPITGAAPLQEFEQVLAQTRAAK